MALNAKWYLNLVNIREYVNMRLWVTVDILSTNKLDNVNIIYVTYFSKIL